MSSVESQSIADSDGSEASGKDSIGSASSVENQQRAPVSATRKRFVPVVVRSDSRPHGELLDQLVDDHKERKRDHRHDIREEEVSRRIRQSLTIKYSKRRHQRMPEEAKLQKTVDRLTTLVLANRDAIKHHCGCDLARWEVCEAFEAFHSKSRDDQRAQILAWFPPGTEVSSQANKQRRFVVPGRAASETLCTACWCKLHGNATWSRVRRHRRMAGDGHVRVPQGKQRVHAKRVNRFSSWNAAVQWLLGFARFTGDHMPDVEICSLPVSSKKELYRVYLDEWKDTHKEGIDRTFHPPLGQKHFLKLFRRHRLSFAVQKHKRFAQCADCHSLKSAIALSKSDAKVARYQALLDRHRQHVASTKAKYYKHCEKARGLRTKSGYLSIIIDGMDQNKTNVPHVVREAKGMDSLEKVNVHVTGFIAHGYMHAIYTWLDNFAKDPNMTMTILMEGLNDLRRLYGPEWKMPRKLYLQLDNPTGENKNKFTIMFLACLVFFAVFDKIKLSFLLVGHTHEDIDQFFSRLSTIWAGVNFYSLPQMMQFAKQVSYKRMTTEALKKLAAANEQRARQPDRAGEMSADMPAPVPASHDQYPELNTRQLVSVANIKLWMGTMTRLRQQWTGITKYKCMVLSARVNPENARRAVVLKVRNCMCSEGDPRCEHKHNYWEPRQPDGKDLDGIVLIPDDVSPDRLPDTAFMPAVPLKPLSITRSQIREFFIAIPGAFDSGANSSQALPVSRDPLITDGVRWVEDLFNQQGVSMTAMCVECRRLRLEAERLKGEVKSLIKAKSLTEALAIYRSDASVFVRADEDDEHDASEGSTASSDADTDMAQAQPGRSTSTRDSLKTVRRQLRQIEQAMTQHLQNPSPAQAKLHREYDTKRLFATKRDGTLPPRPPADADMDEVADDPDDAVDEALPGDDDSSGEEPEYLWEDEKACLLRIGPKRGVRKPHVRGALVGDLALIKVEDQATNTICVELGRILGRDPANTEKVMVHWFGNAAANVNGALLPCWVDAAGTRYYQNKPQHVKHSKHQDSIWPHALVTWSCDWALTKANKVPESAKRRVVLTNGMEEVFK